MEPRNGGPARASRSNAKRRSGSKPAVAVNTPAAALAEPAAATKPMGAAKCHRERCNATFRIGY
eukprot:9966107-Lingulodinium_polyedra.AAC.1